MVLIPILDMTLRTPAFRACAQYSQARDLTVATAPRLTVRCKTAEITIMKGDHFSSVVVMAAWDYTEQGMLGRAAL